jgi:hypothetical protein
LGSVHTIILSSSEGEKIKVSLLSNIIKGLQSDYKIRIDDIKNRIDVDLQRLNGATEADAKESIVTRVEIPKKYITYSSLILFSVFFYIYCPIYPAGPYTLHKLVSQEIRMNSNSNKHKIIFFIITPFVHINNSTVSRKATSVLSLKITLLSRCRFRLR